MTYAFSFGFLVTDDEGRLFDPTRLETITDQLMGAMLERETEAVFDSAIAAALAAGEVEIEIETEAANEREAGALARDFVIESIRAIGGTPVGIFVFADDAPSTSQEWHERRSELVSA